MQTPHRGVQTGFEPGPSNDGKGVLTTTPPWSGTVCFLLLSVAMEVKQDFLMTLEMIHQHQHREPSWRWVCRCVSRRHQEKNATLFVLFDVHTSIYVIVIEGRGRSTPKEGGAFRHRSPIRKQRSQNREEPVRTFTDHVTKQEVRQPIQSQTQTEQQKLFPMRDVCTSMTTDHHLFISLFDHSCSTGSSQPF